MVTEISGAGLGHSGVVQTSTVVASRLNEVSRQVQPGEAPEVLSTDRQASSTAQVAGAYALLRSRQEVLNQAASALREVNNTVEEAGRLLGKMEEDLLRVVKMYPPYPVENPERISLLNSFGGLRRQVDALTFPPPEAIETLGRVLGSQPEASAADAIKPNDGLSDVLDKETMLSIPALDSNTASDEEISKALEHVKATKEFLGDLQSRMWGDVVSFVNQAETSEAEIKGAEVRDLLSDLGGERGAIGRSISQLAAAAES